MSKHIKSTRGKETGIKRARKSLDTVEHFGNKRTKISDEMLVGGWYLRGKGATWLDIKKFFSKEYNIEVGESGIKKRFYKNKDLKEYLSDIDNEQEVGQAKPVATQEKTKSLPLKKENCKPVTTTPKAEVTTREDIANTIVYDEDGVIVLKDKRYKRKDAVYDSGDADIEEAIDKLEGEIKKNKDINLHKVAMDLWRNYVCRYESDPIVRDCVKRGARIIEAPREARNRFNQYLYAMDRLYCHLEEI